MVAQDAKDDDKLEFTPEGETAGYISLDQARVPALQHARDNREFYGRYAERELVWQVVGADETEDFYEVRLSYRPARAFRGRPGVEQFTIDKTGPIEFRQILNEPVDRRGAWVTVVSHPASLPQSRLNTFAALPPTTFSWSSLGRLPTSSWRADCASSPMERK